MKQIILGTAGHIDHGKTSLIKALTGINTDRLKEEQIRGITIELGFASLDLPSGKHLGIVDVPGHEKFVKNMVAGATGIDMVVMVIAADEGVMPQTREHLEICSLLGIEYGMVALTKIDMVDEEWLELVIEDISEFVEGTFLEGQKIVPVSSSSGEGLNQFLQALDEMSEKVPDRPVSNLFRLPVDRVFTMKGFGTVITGSLSSGRVAVGDTIMIYPSLTTSKVRGIQVHGQSVEEAQSGMRTAINFQGLEKTAVRRGEVLSTAGALKPSYMVDVACQYLDSNPKKIKNRALVRFHTGTSEVLGKLILLDRDELQPGDGIEAQIRLDAPVAVVKDDRFVLRSYSPVRTIGGGRVINPIPSKHKRFNSEVIQGLKDLTLKEPDKIISYHVNASEYRGVSFKDLVIMTNLAEKKLENFTQKLLSVQEIVQVDKDNRTFVHQKYLNSIQEQVSAFLQAYHQKNPLRVGVSKEELKSKFPLLASTRLFELILSQMMKAEIIAQEGETVRLTGHKVSLGQDQAGLKKKIADIYLANRLQPPYFKDVVKNLDVAPSRAKDVLMLLVEEGTVIKTKEDLYFHVEAVQQLKESLTTFLEEKGEITTPQFKEMTGASRKYVIPLLEYFDARNVTIRVGDSRKLRQKSK